MAKKNRYDDAQLAAMARQVVNDLESREAALLISFLHVKTGLDRDKIIEYIKELAAR